MLRVLKRKHRIAFAVWHFAERNPFHCLLAQSSTGMFRLNLCRLTHQTLFALPLPASS
jgi:hypothetical protein